ncbi:MAG: A/G-specific adenine glycosylase [Bryobacteraceae bacterium]
MLTGSEIERFQTNLLAWYGRHRRDLPWRRTSDPYAVWISEIMLQQTRVAAAIPYYERFLERFPDVAALACAPEPELLSCWAGLGYYHRARNLQKAARRIAEDGVFPASHEEIRKLPGIGDYTAAAVASIAFGLPHAAVDGNVLRVLSRVFNDATDIASQSGRKRFATLASTLLARSASGDFNQAMMELGATICLPKDPQCLLCPVADLCRVRAAGGRPADLPVKLAVRKSVRETRRLLWIECDGGLLVWQRPAGAALMPGFWELPEAGQIDSSAGVKLGSFRHAITFHRYLFEVFEGSAPSGGECRWLSWTELDQVPTSTVFKKAWRAVARHGVKAERASRFAATLGS